MPIPIPGDLPDPGKESASLASPALAGGFFTTEPLEKSQSNPAATAAKSLQSCPTLQPYGLQPTRLLCAQEPFSRQGC